MYNNSTKVQNRNDFLKDLQSKQNSPTQKICYNINNKIQFKFIKNNDKFDIQNAKNDILA